jgi:hypothetical protein
MKSVSYESCDDQIRADLVLYISIDGERTQLQLCRNGAELPIMNCASFSKAIRYVKRHAQGPFLCDYVWDKDILASNEIYSRLSKELEAAWTDIPSIGPLRKEAPASPSAAQFLFYLFMPPQNCDALVGDLEERYKLIHKKFGRRRADFWYWTQTVMSIGPIVWAWAKKVSLKPVVAVVGWAVGKGLLGHDSWLAVSNHLKT